MANVPGVERTFANQEDVSNICKSIGRNPCLAPSWSSDGCEAEWWTQPPQPRHVRVQSRSAPQHPVTLVSCLTPAPQPRKLDVGAMVPSEGWLGAWRSHLWPVRPLTRTSPRECQFTVLPTSGSVLGTEQGALLLSGSLNKHSFPFGSQKARDICAQGHTAGAPPYVPAPSSLCDEGTSPGAVTCCPQRTASPSSALLGPPQGLGPLGFCLVPHRGGGGLTKRHRGPPAQCWVGGPLDRHALPCPFLCSGPEPPPRVSRVRRLRSPPTT